jgi:hypothetical protein
MATFSVETWVLLGVIAGAGLLAILAILARTFAEEQKIHDLKQRVHQLRGSYSRRLRELGRDPLDGGVIEAIPVEELEAAERQAA